MARYEGIHGWSLNLMPSISLEARLSVMELTAGSTAVSVFSNEEKLRPSSSSCWACSSPAEEEFR